MKKSLEILKIKLYPLLMVLFLFFGDAFGQTLYVETFDGLADGTTSDAGSSGWNIDTSPGNPDLFSKQSQGTLDFFQGNDTDGDVKWFSDLIDISAYAGGVTISYDIAETGTMEGDDYIGIYYNTDGLEGADNTINETFDDFGNTFTTITSGSITGTNIQIVIIINNDSNNEDHYFRNVRVRSLGGTTLYTTGTGDWNDGANWSSVGYGGASCSCSPDETTPINVGNSNTIDISSDVWVNDITIDNTGTLQFTDDDLNLNVEGNGDVTINSGGTFTDGAQTGCDLDFEGDGGAHTLVVNSGSTVSFSTMQINDTNSLTISGDGTLNVEDDFDISSTSTITITPSGTFSIGGDMDFNAAANVTFNGSGTMTILSEFDVNAAATIVNDHTGAFNITFDLQFDATPTSFTNNQTMTISDDIQINSAGVTITNNGTMNVSSDFNLDNSGTTTVTGTGTVNITDDIELNVGGITLTGNQTINVTDDINISNTGATVINGTGSLVVSDDMIFSVSNGSLTTSITTVNLQTSTISSLNFPNNIDNCVLINNGTFIATNGVVILGDNNSITNNGTFTTLERAIFLNSNADDNNTITNNGTFNLSEDPGTGASLDMANADFTFDNNGTVNMDGDFRALNGTESINNNDGATWNYAGDAFSGNVEIYASFGTNTFNYNRGGNQDIFVPQDSYVNLTLSGSGTKTTQGNMDVNGDLTISGTASLDVDSGNDRITLAGNWTNTSTNGDPFVEGNGGERVDFDGTTSQTITNSNGETFNQMRITNSGGNILIAAGTAVTVNNVLTMNGQHIEIGDGQLTIGANASITGPSSTDFIITNGTGELIQNNIGSGGRTGGILFPVGRSSTSYNPLTIDNSTGTADNFGVRVCNNVYQEGGCETGTIQATAVLDKTWFISEAVAGGSDATIIFQWNLANETASFDRTDMNIIHYTGTKWENLLNTAAAGTDPYTGTIPNVSDFSPFSIEDGALAPLPVELVFFNARADGEIVVVDWKTATELNNDYFTIERSIDALNFEEIGTKEGNGSTNESIDYSFVDNSPYGGVSYYRLKQTDFDGTFEYFDIRKVVMSTNNLDVNVYPVPSEGYSINLRVLGLEDNFSAPIRIVNIRGDIVYQDILMVGDEGNLDKTINFNSKLSAGVYTIIVTTDQQIIKKFVVK